MASQPNSTTASSSRDASAPVSAKNRPPRPPRPNYRHIHRFPLPLSVHPLPPLIPHNPLSIISVLLSYLTYVIAPPQDEVYSAYFDSEASSVHVTDEKTVRALWEMGFFGKGSLSRSEPSWLEREKKRRGLLGGVTSEEVTRQRRAERRDLKLERARMEKLAIEQRLQAEAAAREASTPLDDQSSLPPSADGVTNGTIPSVEKFSLRKAKEAKTLGAQRPVAQEHENEGKAVQFSTPVGTQEFISNPSSLHAPDSSGNGPGPAEEATLQNEEHLQLSNEEAFFLVYGLGALHVFDNENQTVLSPNSLLSLFCHHSYSPPREPSSHLKTDDPFLVSYVVYHHFRSLGWVVRSGVKFGVDYLLYNRGPVFSHAEFAIVVIPSYDHPYWSESQDRKAECAGKQARSWWWLHCVNRVQAQVRKSLVVCYVEIPPPACSELNSSGLEATMETQEDSIDFARLQRVALGLVSDRLICGSDSHTNHPALAAKEAIQKSPFDQCSRPEEEKLNAIVSTTDSTKQDPEQTKRRSSPGVHPSKMGPADTLPSDTQIISQSVYDEIIRQNKETGNNVVDSNLGDRATLMTLHEGDSGHIDLLSGFDATNGGHIPNTDEVDDQSSSKLGESSPIVYEPNFFPESQRFMVKTPATAVKRSHSDGAATISPLVSRNPLVPDLEVGSGVMALSQVFTATQAPSSPLVNGLQSDFMSDRPSPNIPIQNRPVAPSLSSPFNTLAATFPRDSSDTQLNYVTMKESQANRDNVLNERLTRSANHIYSEDQSDGEFDKEPSFIERMRRQRKIDEEATAQFATLTAPARQSNRRGRQVNTDAAPEQENWADKPTMDPAPEDELQGSASELQIGGTSEEETEQEEDLPEPIPRSQVPNSSTEEDKENCNDPSNADVCHAASAHDRLSQALSLHESPLPDQALGLAFSNTPSHLRTKDLGGEQLDEIQSSPILVVKDSQRSPGRNDDEQANSEMRGDSQALRNLSQLPSNPSTNVEKRPSPSQHDEPLFYPSHDGPVSRARSNSVASAKLLHEQANTEEGAPIFDSRGKSSSMPSRIAETPVHHRPESYKDVTSWMSDTNNEAADQEDDDLPPVYLRPQGRVTQSQPIISDSSSPLKPLLNSKILSSPSGRQRRALTEIAADASPQVGLGTFDLDINILSADDREFRNAIAMSPIQPRKKRRGNDGQQIYASDPILPVTPRSRSYLPPPREVEEAALETVPPTELAAELENSFQRRSKPSRRVGSIWDTEHSPKFRVSSKERSKIFARSLARDRKLPPLQEPEPKEPMPEVVQPPEEATPIPEVPTSQLGVEEGASNNDQQPPADNPRIAPNQVLAPWSGQKRAYYPATCFGLPFGTSQSRYLVKFEDSAPIERLEFQVGDAVKVDMPNVPKVTHIIRGFKDKLSADDLSREASKGIIPVTDAFGYSTLILGPKQRKSLPSGGLSGPENVIHVPLARVYLDTILWNQLKDRAFTYNSGAEISETRHETPPDRHSTPISPSIRLSRSFRHLNGLFSGMLFAVSYGDNNDMKTRITKMILENDGRILEDGFNELLDLPLNAPVVTPTKSPARGLTGDGVHLRLKPGVEDAGFACLIADKHSRRPKYMQALALNLPCLSDRWVEDCVAKGQIVDWEMYLLPAGESSYLNGATKSRILPHYQATKAQLSETVAARPNLLNGQSVLLITGRSGKADEERRKAYIFLTYALGASRIERVPDIQSARALLNQRQGGGETPGWDWIYIDDDDRASTRAIALASSTAGAMPSKKRRKSKLMESINGDDLGLNTSIRIVGNEF
ncbi:hypothetical protein P175DRAFT_0509502 [Aspergillus ochraceoroseus IBT 24754]|uniref:tRNA-intron lyase n=1 Tax=Aspergillus ochraceoroseus IBT 24754 TaxID=1392256 RepID=A0A2T5LXJ7_9EURO|nr:uncharacterized protein P175DRAFT_0509502 [Aspergillus ochraceoroseus IBT 24754]PTU20999.1 hypothetical protein P175DRAFT_0509502 [Aspergillus ochraceoroseus IBT 24754]